jgi:two-component SAPR family response regulator
MREEIAIYCFGRFEVTRGKRVEEALSIRSKKMKEIFAYLLQRFEKPVGRDELLERFFSGHKDKKTINHLHVIIYKLRHTLESFGINRDQILIDQDYLLKAAPGICDYIDFVNFVKQHSTITGQNAREAEKILSSYRGAYLAEEDYRWAEDEREWLGNQYEMLHLKLAHYYAVNEEAVRAEETLLRLLNFDNLNEEGWQALLQLYLAHPDPTVQAKYLSVYERYSRMLTREFGTEPEERFKKHYLKMI